MIQYTIWSLKKMGFFSISVSYNEILTGRNTRYEQATYNMSDLKNEM